MIILFDGVCNLCNGVVNFIIDRDPLKKFQFASLQSEKGQYLLDKFHLSKIDFDSFVLVDGDVFYQKSTAALVVAKHLNSPWSYFYWFLFLPKSMRDWFYDLIAKNRYSWFGKKESCRIPTPELKDRFL